jgi:CRP-like cAMP-binding protein
LISPNAVKIEELQQHIAFRKLSSSALERLATAMIRQTYASGEVIFLEGEPIIGLWFISQGHVRITKHSSNGRVVGLCLMNKGKCFGTCPLFSTSNNPASAEAIDQVTLLILPQHDIQHLTQHDPNFVAILLQLYSQRLDFLAHLGETFGTWSVADRINDCLLTYADYSANQPIVSLTHEKIAALSGTVREVVTRHLSQLEQDEIVLISANRVVLLDVDALHLPCTSRH